MADSRRQPTPLRMGILGAAVIAPFALVNPARAVDDVAVTAIAARDRFVLDRVGGGNQVVDDQLLGQRHQHPHQRCDAERGLVTPQWLRPGAHPVYQHLQRHGQQRPVEDA